MLTNRRQFIHATSATALASFNILHAEDKAASKRPLVGSGEHTYEVYHDWLTPPAGLMWGDTHGVAQDAAGRLYIAHTVNPASVKKDAIVVYDQLGAGVADPGNYRTRAEIAKYQERDPIVLFKDSLKAAKVFDDNDFDKIETEAAEAVAKAVKFADESPLPDESELMTNVYA